MAKGYTTEEKIEDYTLTDIDETISDQVDRWIEGIEKYIDQYTRRSFVADENASARLYDGDYTDTLIIDDCIEITKVEVGLDQWGGNFTEIDALSSDGGGDIWLPLPANYSKKGVPITAVQLISRLWTRGTQNNRITAKWGYSESVPADIEWAATVLVAGIINAQRKDTKEIASEKIGNYQVSYRDEGQKNDFSRVKEILDSYKRIYL